ncbi:flagellar biosynthetic protein FliO [uncultured Microbacterium sp.]|uniref:flagellar biosynthetic protein FliO n=1 Tax=uncultured Microbacterium sp. TaxID=191216 RepID=UPI0037483BED
MDDLLLAARTVVSLAAVVGLLLFLAKRVQKGQAAGDSPLSSLVPKGLTRRLRPLAGFASRTGAATPSRARGEKITVVARTGLGGRAQLVVAEFGGIRYVLGVSEKGIDVVDTQEAPTEVAEEGSAARGENVLTLTDAGTPSEGERSGVHAA